MIGSVYAFHANLSVLCSSLGYAKATVFASFSGTGTGTLIRLQCNSSFNAQSVKETVRALRSKPIEVSIYHSKSDLEKITWEDGVNVIELPTQSSDIDPIDTIFQDIMKEVFI